MFFNFRKFRSIILSGLKLDFRGIPHLVGLKKLGYYPYPITVALYGLYQYQLFEETGDEKYLNSALVCGDYLLSKSSMEDGQSLWRHNFPLKFLGISPGWICGLTQALGAGLFFYLKKHKKSFKGLDRMAIEPLFHHLNEGGLANSIGDYHFLEEYPSNPPSATLNGFMYILLVLELLGKNGDKNSLNAYEFYFDNLKDNLHLYDARFWSFYDLWKMKRLASKEYHYLHIGLLERLYKITGEEKINDYRKQWEFYWRSSKSRLKWYIHKAEEKTKLYFSER